MKHLPIRVEKPWGYELIFGKTDHYAGKILSIRQGQSLSLQFHERKEETIFVLKGRLLFLFEETPGGSLVEIVLEEGEAHHIPRQRKHRMVGLTDCTLCEVSTPQLDDVVRLNDAYGRA